MADISGERIGGVEPVDAVIPSKDRELERWLDEEGARAFDDPEINQLLRKHGRKAADLRKLPELAEKLNTWFGKEYTPEDLSRQLRKIERGEAKV